MADLLTRLACYARGHQYELAGAYAITAHCQIRVYACARTGCTLAIRTEYHPGTCSCPVPDPIAWGRRWGDKRGLT